MKVGDLIRMKRCMFWHLKGNPSRHYTEVPFIALEVDYNAIKMMWPDGRIACDLVENYDVVNEVD